ncbi:MAG: hypothetical protein SchgKO_18370 [Schleiferiaceae bacterium]
MRILFLSRSTLWSQIGGDTIQVQQSAQALRDRGHHVDIIAAGEAVKDSYDLVHFFNLGRPQDAIPYMSSLEVPWITSTIWVDYSTSEAKRKGLLGRVMNRFSPSGQEYVKSVARGVLGKDNLPGIPYLLKGHEAAIEKVIDHSSALICSTEIEAQRLVDQFSPKTPIHSIGLGVSEVFWEHTEFVKRNEGVICVGRFEVLKNQKSLIKVLVDMGVPALFVGNPSTNQPQYYLECLAEAEGSQIEFREHVSPQELATLYRRYKTVVIPSFFETFGLTGIEGWASGCSLAVSKTLDSTDQYIQLGAEIFSPTDDADMKKAIETALQKKPQTVLKKQRDQYSWKGVAQSLEDVYNSILQTS